MRWDGVRAVVEVGEAVGFMRIMNLTPLLHRPARTGPDMQNIHVRPPAVGDRLIPGHWKGDLIKGAGNRSSIGTLVERTSGFVVLVKMNSASATDALDGFGNAFERTPSGLRKSMTYSKPKDTIIPC